ncbi:MAG: CAP domain-containing protein [Acidimicrobiales bacterium]
MTGEAVVSAFETEYAKPTPAIEWTGDRATCNAGTTSQAYRTAVVERINYFRAMAGVPVGVVENANWSAQAQQAAVSMSATGRLSHNPDSSFACFNSTVKASAGASNLYLGRTGPAGIGYVQDPGASNVSTGHRSWIFHSTLQEVGVGDLPSSSTNYSANTLQVIDANRAFASEPTLREGDGFVAWPVRGYNPGALVFDRWSFTLRGATFESANVTVSRGGQPLSSTEVHRSDPSQCIAPFPNIVWEPQGVDKNPATDVVYTVTVSNVTVGAQQRTYTYDVIVLGSRPAPVLAVRPQRHRIHAPYITAAYNDFLGRNPTPTRSPRGTPS